MVTINPSDSNYSSGSPNSGTTQDIGISSRGFVHEPDLADVPVTAGGRPAPLSRVPWGAVIAGTLAAISIMVLSASLAYAVGVSAYGDARPGVTGDYHYSVGAGIWAIVTAFIAFFVGGMLAAHLSSTHRHSSSMVNGLMTWFLGVPLLLWLSTNALGMFHSLFANNAVQTNINQANQQNWQSGPAWGTFLSLLVGLVAAGLGGGSTLMDKTIDRTRDINTK